MAIFMVLVIVVVLLCISGFLASILSDAAEQKGYEKRRYFYVCFWLGIFGYCTVIALPDVKLQEQNEQIISLLKANSGNAGKDKVAPSVPQNTQLPSL